MITIFPVSLFSFIKAGRGKGGKEGKKKWQRRWLTYLQTKCCGKQWWGTGIRNAFSTPFTMSTVSDVILMTFTGQINKPNGPSIDIRVTYCGIPALSESKLTTHNLVGIWWYPFLVRTYSSPLVSMTNLYISPIPGFTTSPSIITSSITETDVTFLMVKTWIASTCDSW